MQVGRCGAETESGPVSVCWCEGGRLRPWRGHSTGLFPSCRCQRRVWRSNNTNLTRKFAIFNSTTWLLHVEILWRLALVITRKRTREPTLVLFAPRLKHNHHNFTSCRGIVLACGNRLRSPCAGERVLLLNKSFHQRPFFTKMWVRLYF